MSAPSVGAAFTMNGAPDAPQQDPTHAQRVAGDMD